MAAVPTELSCRLSILRRPLTVLNVVEFCWMDIDVRGWMNR